MVLPQPGYTTFAEIDTRLLQQNIQLLKKHAGNIALMAVIKADAYGHGMTAIVPYLLAAGLNHFMVATLDEAVKLREYAPDATILVASPPHPKNLPVYVALQLDASITSAAIAEQVLAAKNISGLSVHVKVDTGMNRLGLSQAVAPDTISQLMQASSIRVAGIWSHLATAGDRDKTFARRQIDAAYAVLDAFPMFDGYFHVGNSGTLLNLRDHIGRHPKELIRLGGALLGIPASQRLARQFGLKPIMALKSRVIHINDLQPGESVSYGKTWTATSATRIAVIGAGYADGYPSALS
ncbi:MAG: alanine racemase, partial [Bacteroidota bacterium]